MHADCFVSFHFHFVSVSIPGFITSHADHMIFYHMPTINTYRLGGGSIIIIIIIINNVQASKGVLRTYID